MKVICHSAKGTTWKKHKYITKTIIGGNVVYKYPPGAIGEGAHDESGGGQASDTYYALTETGLYDVNTRSEYKYDSGGVVLDAIESKSKDAQNTLKLMSLIGHNSDRISSIRGIRNLNPIEKLIDTICNGGKKQKAIYDKKMELADQVFEVFTSTAKRRKIKYYREQ